MYPSVYLYKVSGNQHELYLGGYSTLEGIGLFDKEACIQIHESGATNYQRYGWATEKEIPTMQTIAELLRFLEKETCLGLVTFRAEIISQGSLSSHDDAECHICLSSKQQLFKMIKHVSPQVYQDKLLAALIQHPEIYLTLDEEGIIHKYHSFEQYLQANPD